MYLYVRLHYFIWWNVYILMYIATLILILTAMYIYLYHGVWMNQRVLPWYNYNTTQWLVVISWW